jgi:hypothetical protein
MIRFLRLSLLFLHAVARCLLGNLTWLMEPTYPRSQHFSKPSTCDDNSFFFDTLEVDCHLALDETTPFSAASLNGNCT